jgi:uncharacterized damage-inducible protein DinB
LTISFFEPFLLEWRFARGLSLDLLSVLSNEDLAYSPGFGMGPLWKQFRHTGRVQEDYVLALVTGKVSFSTQGKSLFKQENAEGLRSYLSACDEEMLKTLQEIGEDLEIDWFGERVGAKEHMWRMVAHETFHHGQWVVYMRGLNKPFPPSWSAWGF